MRLLIHLDMAIPPNAGVFLPALGGILSVILQFYLHTQGVLLPHSSALGDVLVQGLANGAGAGIELGHHAFDLLAQANLV